MILMSTDVHRDWVDYNGHMNDAEYARVFSMAVEALMVHIGLDDQGRQHHEYTLYTLETHLCYLHEVKQGEQLQVSVAILDRDPKRLHLYFDLLDDHGRQVATSEQMLLGIRTDRGQAAPFPSAVEQLIDSLPHLEVSAWPVAVGRRIGIRR